MNVKASVLRLLDVGSNRPLKLNLVSRPDGGGPRTPSRASLSHALVVTPVCCPHCGASRR